MAEGDEIIGNKYHWVIWGAAREALKMLKPYEKEIFVHPSGFLAITN